MSWVYFIRAEGTGLVKIGVAADPWKRLSKIQSDCPCECLIVATEEGGKAREAELHTIFVDLRARGEWFHERGAVAAHLATLPPVLRSRPQREESLQAKIIRETGISKAYASMIVNGLQRPARRLAIEIFRKTGWRHEVIAGLSDNEMEVFERHDPWARPAERNQDRAA